MAFSQFKRRTAIGWFRELQEAGKPLPGLRAISNRFDLDMDQASRLIEELTHDGLIELVTERGKEWVRVLVAPGHATVQATKTAAMKDTQGASGTARKAPSGSGSPEPSRINDRAPPPAPEAKAPPAPTPPPSDAAAEGPWPEHAELCAVTFDRGHKPFVAAPIIRAARERGEPLDQFLTALINIGWAEHRKAQS